MAMMVVWVFVMSKYVNEILDHNWYSSVLYCRVKEFVIRKNMSRATGKGNDFMNRLRGKRGLHV